jgi:uncharacterized protein YecA (UPF0149 family)
MKQAPKKEVFFSYGNIGDGSVPNVPKELVQVGRNDLSCGSGKKYKKCCGRDLK